MESPETYKIRRKREIQEGSEIKETYCTEGKVEVTSKETKKRECRVDWVRRRKVKMEIKEREGNGGPESEW